jgi:signal transduction histidine kinase
MSPRKKATADVELKTALLASAMLHEVKQPLNAINLNAELARRKLAEDQRGPIDAIERAGDRVQATLEAFARACPALPLPEEPVDLAPVFAPITGVEIAVKELPECVASVEQLRLAVEALVDNARRAGGKIVLSAKADENDLHIVVADQGCGMTAEIVKRAPEIGFSTWGRAGIGMTLAKFVTYHHAGSFTIESAPDKGTKVSMVLPLTIG